jgi:hypothetical protein
MMADVTIAEFPSLTSTAPSARGIEWDELAQRLLTFSERQKKDGPGWSPAIYKRGQSRGNEGVVALTAAVIDFDHEEPEWGLLEAFEYVAHTTYSHHQDNPSCPHWRVILPFADPVRKKDWKDTWRKLQFWLAPGADEACKDEARFYWWPSCKPDADHDARWHRGAFLDPETLRDVPEEKPRLTPVDQTGPASGPDGERPGDRFTRETDWSEILTGWRLLSTRGPERRWMRPENGVPKQTPGCSATTGGGGYDVLYVFSSNAAPFEANKSYTKFRAYSLIHHAGDDRAAATALHQRYWGTAPTLGPLPAGGTAHQEPQPAPEPTPFLRPISELLAMEETEPDWLVQDLFTAGSSGWVSAEPKVGKSWTVLELIYALSTGTPFLGRFDVSKRRRVIYIQEEDSVQRVLRRFKKILRGTPGRVPPSDEYLRWSVRVGFKLDNPQWIASLRAELDAYQADVVVLDVFNRLHLKNENEQSDMTALLDTLITLTREYGCAFIVVHHNKKAQPGFEARPNQLLRGSGVLAGWSECSLYMRKAKQKGTFIIIPESKDAPELEEFAVTLVDTEDNGIVLQIGEVGIADRQADMQAKIIQTIDALNEENLDATVMRIADRLRIDRKTATKYLNDLVDAGLIDEDEVKFGKTNAKIYLRLSQ